MIDVWLEHIVEGEERSSSRKVKVTRHQISMILTHLPIWKTKFKKGAATRKTSIQGIVDGSASKPAFRQDTGNMVEKTYHDIAPDLWAFGANSMPN